ncbi:calmodulin-like protein 5 [Lolium rigidum]|jgi:calmodulin|uniref:calmodulin-like protein 5 n=1 Tax=Lolium rigidum TaxID=89674 RepID=UPI001F5CF31D|nr:calmodulin-like protein 5 [Lolium rigidum]XP_047049818.1 calmodulin-like protein 5 [Lolium rigidum]XP_051188088.1 calmodulin-like protein 5 [Lolium perenne]
MAIRNQMATRSLDGDMTVDEFKEWLRRFDVNHDGRINREELRCAMRTIRTRFSGYKSKRGIDYADANGDGCIDDSEVDGLIDYAQKSLGLRIVAY